MATCIEPIIPTITLTEPTPSPSQEASATPQETTLRAMPTVASEEDTCSAIDQHPQEMYQFHPPTPINHPQYSRESLTQSLNPTHRFVPRAAEDYQNMLQAMATGNFDIPVFGTTGAAFQNRLAARAVTMTPSTVRANVSLGIHQQRTWTQVSDIPPIPDTPTLQPKKRKRAETLHDTDSHEVERAPKKPAGRKKKQKKKPVKIGNSA
jgi:hypothetical protein